MTTKSFIFLGLLVFCSKIFADGQLDVINYDEIKYRGWLDDAVVTFILPKDGEVESIVQGSRDSTSTAIFCSLDSQFFCISTHTLEFAIPKCERKMKSSWTYGNYEYRVLKRDKKVTLFGRTMRDLYLIEVFEYLKDKPDNGMSQSSRFVLFSFEMGIVGYAQKMTLEPTPTFWLAGEIGLGSSDVDDLNCRDLN